MVRASVQAHRDARGIADHSKCATRRKDQSETQCATCRTPTQFHREMRAQILRRQATRSQQDQRLRARRNRFQHRCRNPPREMSRALMVWEAQEARHTPLVAACRRSFGRRSNCRPILNTPRANTGTTERSCTQGTDSNCSTMACMDSNMDPSMSSISARNSNWLRIHPTTDSPNSNRAARHSIRRRIRS